MATKEKLVTLDNPGQYVLPESLAKRIDHTGKSKDPIMSYRRLAMEPSDFQLDVDSRSDISVITTESVDRDDEVVISAGAILEDYKRNPVVTWAHNYEAL